MNENMSSKGDKMVLAAILGGRIISEVYVKFLDSSFRLLSTYFGESWSIAVGIRECKLKYCQ